MNCLVCNQLMDEETGYSRCSTCGLVKILSPLRYNLDDYTQTYKSWFGSELEIRINLNRVATLMRFVPFHKRVLDFGCSCGNFLARLEQYPYTCQGYEASRTAPANKTCVAPIHTDIEQIEGKFDCITLFDVFEHFDNPVRITTYLASLLKPGGHLILMTPNPEFQTDLENFYHLKPGEHAYLWSESALTRFMKEYGLYLCHSEFSEGWIRQNANTNEDRRTNALLTTIFCTTQ